MTHEMIKRLGIESGRRVICISDIHAHPDLLDRLLEKARFTPEDLLLIIGDVIENGPDVLGTLRRVMELSKTGSCIALAGNWDYHMHIWLTSDDPVVSASLLGRTLELEKDYGSSLFSDMCRNAGIPLGPGSDVSAILPVIRKNFAEEIAFMGSMPIMLDCGEFVCLHGGAEKLDEAYIYSKDPYDILKNDSFATQGHTFDRWLITGHWPVSNYDEDVARFSPHIFPESRIAAIDGGCGKLQAAQLNALMLRAGSPEDFEWDYVDDFPKVRALEAQQPSENPLHTVWNTRFIDLIEMGGEFSRVLHWDTGRELVVPTARLWQQAGEYMLGDYTDYALSVEKGDVLGVVMETSRGLYCKNGSVCGWYYGGYAPEH